MKEDELMVDVYMIVQKIFMYTVLFYKYLLTLLQKYYVDKGVMVNIPYLLNFKNLYYEKNLFDYGSSARWYGQRERKEK